MIDCIYQYTMNINASLERIRFLKEKNNNLKISIDAKKRKNEALKSNARNLRAISL
jgi:hypothetical protein